MSEESFATIITTDKHEIKKKVHYLVDMHGYGSLVLQMRKATASGDYRELDNFIMETVGELIYNQGKGKLLPVAELVKMRNEERNAKLGAFSRKKEKGKKGVNVLEHMDTAGAGDMIKALKLLDGGGKGGRGESKYREIHWKLEERGQMGEGVITVCLLHGTTVHNLIVIRLLELFPRLVNDICISEDYYGLTPLHQAIINHDVGMVSKLLRKGADVNARCYGAFFSAEDQKSSRQDSLEHEYVELCIQSDFKGNMYFGEYPLSFAVCMSLPDIFRLLLAKKANLNAQVEELLKSKIFQDTNGNTVLHLCVIHEKLDMLHLCLEHGANLMIINKQKLTPLTLAAKLAKKKFFDTILELECEKVWSYGDASCAAYPLTKIDTIDEQTGEMNEESALALVVYGEDQTHLELLDGLLEGILDAKWKSYGRKRWYLSLVAFLIYYCIFTMAFMVRPFSANTEQLSRGMVTIEGEVCEESDYGYCFQNESSHWDPLKSQCHLLDYERWGLWGHIRMAFEGLVVFFVLVQIIMDLLDIRRIGKDKWFSIMKTFPAKLLYKLSWFLILACIPIRLGCRLNENMLYIENALITAAVVLTTLHFLYFLRAVPFVGPFVLMIYSIIRRDLSRFLLIYSIFLVGFSQSFYMMFTTCERTSKEREAVGLPTDFENVIQTPGDALIRTFIMTIGEFSVLYREMSACDSDIMRHIGKIMFVLFEVCVSILQFNLLIAMMTRTYETIFLTRKEWKRQVYGPFWPRRWRFQWAQVILMLEMSLSKHDRLLYLLKYSRPTGTNKKKRSYVVRRRAQMERTEEEELNLREEKAEKIRQERKAVLRKRQRELEIRTQALRLMEKVVSRKVVRRQATVQ